MSSKLFWNLKKKRNSVIFWNWKFFRARSSSFGDFWNRTNKNIPDRQHCDRFRNLRGVSLHPYYNLPRGALSLHPYYSVHMIYNNIKQDAAKNTDPRGPLASQWSTSSSSSGRSSPGASPPASGASSPAVTAGQPKPPVFSPPNFANSLPRAAGKNDIHLQNW